MPDGSVKCLLCFHECVIGENKTGLCRVRGNVGGELYNIGYGKTISMSIDPIEKKPLYHFKPGSVILSIGPNGCNLDCPYCQNSEISQENAQTIYLSPENAGKLSRKNGSVGLAYTYTEPLVWYEYILDAGEEVKKNGGCNVIVSNGVINEAPLKKIIPLIDAANIDLKTFSSEKYRKILKGDLDSVLRTIRLLKENSVHVEVTTLVVTGFNDTDDEIENSAKFIASVDPRIPYHISRYFPHYKYEAPPTSEEKLGRFYEIAKNYLSFVYLGNTFQAGKNDTYCPDCLNLWIERSYFSADIIGIRDGKCSKCGRDTGIQF